MSESVMILDMNDLNTKRKLMTRIGSLKGLWEVSLKERKRTRTLNQNSYYFAAVVTPFRDWLRETDGDPSITTEQAHEALKSAVLGTRTVVNSATGEVVEIPPPTRTMKSDDFTAYVEASAKWLAEFCGIVVLEPEMFYEK
jgi:hypothetical protein